MAEIIEDRSLRNKISVFRDRSHAGELLSEWLEDYREKDACVLAIPAGGVPVGVEISKRLNLPLDLAVVRKIHIPWNREAGFGAMAWDGIILLNEDLVKHLELSKKEIDDCITEEREEIEERMKLFGCGKFPDIGGKRVILVDDWAGIRIYDLGGGLFSEEKESKRIGRRSSDVLSCCY
ncbi:MAG: Phosphoribosyl transferase domain protein [Candidatus Methanolliviera sp. GoM_asphalt]|nr:MAG: Phosphoribosyl transferase domain protein [Candidatus Methanolliviera sp. GoM_asphalt]